MFILRFYWLQYENVKETDAKIHSLTGSIHQLSNDDFEMIFSVYKTYSLETWLLCLY